MTGAVQRARKLTMWSLGCTLLLGWFGVLGGLGMQVADHRADPLRLAVTAVAVAVFTWSGLRLVRAVSIGWPQQRRRSHQDSAVSGIAVLVVLLVQDATPGGWGLLAVAWASTVTARTGRLATLLVAAGTAVTCIGLHWLDPGPEAFPLPAAVVFYTILCLALPYANKLWIWILELAEQAHASKDAEARLAVTEERLRFARDLHDLVGHSLSVIAVKSELAGKLTTIDTGRAAAEMAQVRGLAQDSLRQIRAAVRGYRVLDLASEVASVQAILEADGIRCKVDIPPGVVDPAAAGPLAWVVRESATNILRHSSAGWCTITLRAADGSAVLEIVNDGVVDPLQTGTGLAGLAERLAAVGGSLTAQATGDGRFLVRAIAPISAAAEPFPLPATPVTSPPPGTTAAPPVSPPPASSPLPAPLGSPGSSGSSVTTTAPFGPSTSPPPPLQSSSASASPPPPASSTPPTSPTPSAPSAFPPPAPVSASPPSPTPPAPSAPAASSPSLPRAPMSASASLPSSAAAASSASPTWSASLTSSTAAATSASPATPAVSVSPAASASPFAPGGNA